MDMMINTFDLLILLMSAFGFGFLIGETNGFKKCKKLADYYHEEVMKILRGL